MRAIKNCPECKGDLQASVTIYLSDVVLKDGAVSDFNMSDLLPHTDDFRSSIEGLVQAAEGDELRIYCANDHQISLDGEVEDES